MWWVTKLECDLVYRYRGSMGTLSLRNFLLICFMFLTTGSKALAIVGGVTANESLPSYLTALDRAAIQSHTVVILNTQTPGVHSRCTGTLIAANVVLTAAHCVPKNLNNIFVVPSIYEFSVASRLKAVNSIVHEKYNSFNVPQLNQPNWDIALIRFEGNLPPEYKPTVWMSSFTPNIDRFWLYVAGYGKSADKKDDTGELRFSRVTIEQALFNINQSFLQGNQNNGEGICNGDSGGPAFIKIQDRFYVLGITSAIVRGCQGTSYFNQTTYYKDWIESSLNQILNGLVSF